MGACGHRRTFRSTGGFVAMGVAFALLSATPTVGRAADRQPVECRITAGFDGVAAGRSSLTPVSVTIDNAAIGSAGSIEITQPQASARPEVRYTHDFVSPAPSVKTFTLYVRAEGGSSIRVDVNFKERIPSVSRVLDLRSSNRPLILCVGVPRGYRSTNLATAYAFASIGPSALPDDPLALEGVPVVMLGGGALAALPQGPLRALGRWLATGGTLVLVEPLDEEAFRRNLEVVAGRPEPRAIRSGYWPVGAGLLASAGTDSSPESPFWETDSAIQSLLFPEVRNRDGDSFFPGQGGWRGLLSHVCQSRRTRGWTGFFWVLLIVAAYVVVIGPVDRFICRRFQRPFLTWFIFPAAIAGFSVLAYTYSRMVNIGAMRMVQVSIADTSADGGALRGGALFWIYSAKNAAYEIGAPVPGVCFSARETALGAGGVARVDVRNGRHPALSARIPIFSGKEFDAAWYAPGPGPTRLSESNGGLRIAPPAGLKIRAARLADAHGLRELKPDGAEWVEAGDSLDPWPTVLEAASSRLQGFSNRQYNYYGDSESDRMPAARDMDALATLLSFGSRAGTPGTKPGGAIQNLVREQNAREGLLDIGPRLDHGRVLLLFLEPDDALLPVAIRLHWPESARVSLLRIQLPAGP